MSASVDLDTAATVENPVLDGVHPAEDKRQNGNTPSDESSNSASDQALATRDSLGSRVAVSEMATVLASNGNDSEQVRFADLDVPGADPSDAVEPLAVTHSQEQYDEAVAFFKQAKKEETTEQKQRARDTSRVFSLMQYEVRETDSGREQMLTQKQLDDGLESLRDRLHRWAYVWHDQDRLVEVDEGTTEMTCVGLKDLHVHMVLWLKDGDKATVRTVSDALQVPSARVRTPNEAAKIESLPSHKGRGAAEKAFFDLVEYLPHESRRGNAIQGVCQPERHYLVDATQPGHPGKYQYGRGRVVSNFDFSKELDAHMAGRVVAADGGQSLRARKIKLRRAVMDGMGLFEAREKDRDAYADDLPRLRELAREYNELTGKEVAEQIGPVWRKSFVLAAGPTRQGKDLLLGELGVQLVWVAGLAGLDWRVVKPAGRNALEGIGRAEIVHHEDLRYKVVPDYDEGLRYFDPNQAVEAATRFHNTTAPTPRAIMASTSETLLSMGLTLKRRADSGYLAELAGDRKTAPKVPLDIDEFLFRIGWYIEVTKADDAGDDVDRIRDGMLVSIFRVRETNESQTQQVHTRGGDWVGDVRTRHELEPVAMIKGCTEAARFLAVSIVQERNPDVVEAIPPERMLELVAGRLEIEADAQALKLQREQERIAASEEAELRAAEVKRDAEQRQIERLEEELRLLKLCTCDGNPPISCLHKHEDECPVLPDDQRRERAEQRRERAEAQRREGDEKVARLRANGLVFDEEASRTTR